LLAVLAERFFGFHLGRRQWTGLVITAVGLAIIGITQGAQPSEPPGYALAALISIECGVLLLATGLAVMAGRLEVLQAREGLLLGAAAGALFGISDIALKFLTHAVGDGLLELISPWTFAALAASVIAFYVSARGLQIGPGVEVIALTSVAQAWPPSSAASCLRRADRLRPARDRRPHRRLLPRHRWRGAHAVPPHRAARARPDGAAGRGACPTMKLA
jgi:drug/metabolite transporter (DMT)-like permease